jgi:hypothetical protein
MVLYADLKSINTHKILFLFLCIFLFIADVHLGIAIWVRSQFGTYPSSS